MNLTFKQGKFYNKTGQAVALEFGNKEQIQLMGAMNSMKEEGRLFIGSTFKCFCGAVHDKLFMDGKKFKCECGAKYQFYFKVENL